MSGSEPLQQEAGTTHYTSPPPPYRGHRRCTAQRKGSKLFQEKVFFVCCLLYKMAEHRESLWDYHSSSAVADRHGSACADGERNGRISISTIGSKGRQGANLNQHSAKKTARNVRPLAGEGWGGRGVDDRRKGGEPLAYHESKLNTDSTRACWCGLQLGSV